MKSKSVHSCRFVHHAKFHCVLTTLKKLFKIEFERRGETGKEPSAQAVVKMKLNGEMEKEKEPRCLFSSLLKKGLLSNTCCYSLRSYLSSHLSRNPDIIKLSKFVDNLQLGSGKQSNSFQTAGFVLSSLYGYRVDCGQLLL